ncbi:hypothetical protein AMJ44_04425 [candidate division WOR-1 bacterium DG_54_3]|uniref:Uncharacterized protein n=1 Tax=candidate division WOR-1 bacterium DG_54_3 TaxID=1703775 RepID=A0A0S7Y3B7_UNCSA|nr:MAG: hypothetical protein AMJ44_04425 [candidate division WOR-1 bacterium DG_54_3]
MSKIQNNQNLNLTSVNMDNLNNKDWSNCDAKTANMKFKQTVMTNHFKKYFQKAAKSAKKRTEEAGRI